MSTRCIQAKTGVPDKLDRKIRWRMHDKIFENPEEIEEIIPFMRGLDKDAVRQYARDLAVLLRQWAMCQNCGVHGKRRDECDCLAGPSFRSKRVLSGMDYGTTRTSNLNTKRISDE